MFGDGCSEVSGQPPSLGKGKEKKAGVDLAPRRADQTVTSPPGDKKWGSFRFVPSKLDGE